MKRLWKPMVLMVAVITLVACGADDDPEPTAAPQATSAPTMTTVPTEQVEVAATDAANEAATAESAATPVTGLAATPATPVTMATPIASPVATPIASPIVAAPGEMIQMNGVVTLIGTEGTEFELTDEGCVGQDGYGRLHAGTQVVVRDGAGTIVAVTTLEDDASADGCGWRFTTDVPDAPFYSVSIASMPEYVVSGVDMRAAGGIVEIALP